MVPASFVAFITFHSENEAESPVAVTPDKIAILLFFLNKIIESKYKGLASHINHSENPMRNPQCKNNLLLIQIRLL